MNTGSNHVFPSGLPAMMARDDVVEVQFRSGKNLSAVLAPIVIPFVYRLPTKLDLLGRETVVIPE